MCVCICIYVKEYICICIHTHIYGLRTYIKSLLYIIYWNYTNIFKNQKKHQITCFASDMYSRKMTKTSLGRCQRSGKRSLLAVKVTWWFPINWPWQDQARCRRGPDHSVVKDSPVARGTNLILQSNTAPTWTRGLRIPIYSFAIVFMKVSSCEVQKKTDTNENQNFIITFRNHSAQPRNASNLWLLGQLSGTPACLSNGLATNNLVPILKPAKCGLLKLSSTSQLW